jgi:hypothetical protein
MSFQSTDDGPFWITPIEREKQRHDIILEGQVVKKKLTKKEFLERLLTCGITMKGKIADLQRAATNQVWKDRRGSPKVCCRCCGREAGLVIAMVDLLIIIPSPGERINST